MDVKSEPGKGTTFTVYLPVVAPVVAPVAPVETQVFGGHERILVVDDEPGQLVLSKRALKRLGYDVSVVSRGDDATKLFEEALQAGKPVPFDLVVRQCGRQAGTADSRTCMGNNA